GEIEPQGDIAAARIGKAVELFVGLLPSLAQQNLRVFESRRIDGREAVGAIDAPGDLEQALPRYHQLGGIIAKSLERSWLDEVGHVRIQGPKLKDTGVKIKDQQPDARRRVALLVLHAVGVALEEALLFVG